MSEGKMIRLSQAARKLNVGTSSIVDFLGSLDYEIENKPNTKLNSEQFAMLEKEFMSSAMDKEEASSLNIGNRQYDDIRSKKLQEAAAPDPAPIQPKEDNRREGTRVFEKKEGAVKENVKIERATFSGPKVIGKIDLDAPSKPKPKVEEKVVEAPKAAEAKVVPPKVEEKVAPPVEIPKPAKEIPVVVKTPVVEAKEEPVKAPVEKAPEPVVEAKKEEAPKEVKAAETPKPPVEKAKPAPTPETLKATEKPAETPKPAKEAAPKAAEPTKPKSVEPVAPVANTEPDNQVIKAKAAGLKGLTVLGKIELPKKKKAEPVASSDKRNQANKKKRPRKRIPVAGSNANRPRGTGGQGARRPVGGGGARGKRVPKAELTDAQIQEQIKATLAKLSGKRSTGNRSKYRKDKRSAVAEATAQEIAAQEEQAKVLQVTEFISANDLANLMDVSVTEVISSCMSMGMFVSINQRLDAESITVISDEFGYNVEFVEESEDIDIVEVEDNPEDLEDRAPIVTIMGHVDHGKTSLLDYIRSAKVTEGEAGGITQHIGAYDVMTNTGKRVSFLDTPGHEAFTAMRARGAKLTDIVIVVIAADDSVMPQTKEALNHAQVAGVPIVIALNKIDKPGANPDRVREELSAINILVEEWGGKYQSQEISAKTGAGIDELLEKVLLEAELLELKANPNKAAIGSVIESSLDKGRGYVTTVMVQEGSMKVGDVLLAGHLYGKVKAMFDHRGKKIKMAGPSIPVQLLGLDGAVQAGDRFHIMDNEREARDIANKREQINREQSIRTKKHITLDEIGRRLAIGNFKELNVIVKGDVDGSIEALSDSLLKLSTEEIQVNIIHKGVGAISESDVLLASASDAIIVGFQVRPSGNARKIAENEQIEIRLYSIIYDAINEIKDAMEGMLAPTVEEVITGNIEVREVYKISKVGTVAGCYVTEGSIQRNNQIRLIREGIVIHTGSINQLKRFKDDVSEVKNNYECGLSIHKFHDIKVGDVVEGFTMKEIKRTL